MKRRLWIVGGLLLFAAAVLLFRTPLRKWYNRQYNRPPVSSGTFQNPEAIAFDADGSLYVGDQDLSAILVFDPAGKPKSVIKMVEGYLDGDGRPGPISRGLYMVFPEPGRLLFVARHNIVELDVTGPTPKLLRTIGKRGSAPGEMDGPEGISLDANGDLYATDEHNRRINVWDKERRYLRSWSVPEDPQCVLVHGDRVYVSLNKRNYIAAYSKEGVELFRVGHAALYEVLLWIGLPAAAVAGLVLALLKRPRAAIAAALLLGLATAAACGWDAWRHGGPGETRHPDHMVLSPDGKRLYVADRFNGRVQVFDPEGRFLFGFGKEGASPGHFQDPIGMAFDREGNLWVADSGNHRLQVFTADGKFVRALQ